MNEKIKGIPVKDVEADEIWGFVKMKRNTRAHKGIADPLVGDAYTFVGIERNAKLVLAWHMGDRDTINTEAFTEKLNLRQAVNFNSLRTALLPILMQSLIRLALALTTLNSI